MNRYHARPAWMVQEEELRRQRARARRYELVRKGVEYASYIALAALVAIVVIIAMNEAGGL